MDQITAAAARVAAKRKELEQRLAELHDAHPIAKLRLAGLVAATFLELLDHQSTFNDQAMGELSRLSSRVALLEHRPELGSPAVRL